MQVNKKSLGSIILQTFFDIPNYQRLYAWEYDNWYDLYESFLHNYESKKHYFLGSLIIKTKNLPNIVDVIDGQQRLTTICILLKAIEDILQTNGDDFYVNEIKSILNKEIEKNKFKYRISHNKVDKENFEFIINNNNENIEKQFSQEKSKHKMILAYQFFYNILQGKQYNEKSKKYILEEKNEIKIFSPQDLINLYEFIKDYCQLIEIALSEDENEQEIFNTMNSTGLKLSTGDLLKNYFFQNETLKEKHLSMWQKIFEEDDDSFSGDEKINFWSAVVSSNRGNTNLDLIMYSALLIEETSKDFSVFKQETSYKDLFSAYKTMLTTDSKKEEILLNIFNLAQVYLDLHNKPVNTIDFNNKLNLLLFIIKTSGYNVFYPLVIFLHNNKNINDDSKNKAYMLISKLATFNSVLSRQTSYLNKAVSQILHNAQTKGITEAMEELIKYFNNKIASNNNDLLKEIIAFNFNGSAKKNKIILFLSLIEAHKRGDKSEQLFEYNSTLQSIEHIIPQKHKAHYNIVDENIIHNIGNLTLLSKPNNSQASNKKFADKKDIYKKSPLTIVRELAENNDITEDFIKNRSESFGKMLLDIFK